MSIFKALSLKLFQAFLCTLIICLPVTTFAADEHIISTEVKGNYHDIANSIRSAIIGKGIHIAHELSASDMLNRTGSAYGYKNNTYTDARIFEFCSASLSQKLARQNPDNIVLCPFTISVYTLVDEPDTVHIAYKKPVGKDGSEAIVEEVMEEDDRELTHGMLESVALGLAPIGWGALWGGVSRVTGEPLVVAAPIAMDLFWGSAEGYFSKRGFSYVPTFS